MFNFLFLLELMCLLIGLNYGGSWWLRDSKEIELYFKIFFVVYCYGKYILFILIL